MAYASTVPAAFTALLAAFTSTAGLAGVEVRDGPQAPDTSATEAVYVGWDGDPSYGSDAWTSRENPEGLGGPDRETYSVHCSVMVLNADEDLAATRARAFVLRAAAGAAIAADQTLGRTVLRAVFGAGSGRQVPVLNGIKVYALFDVDCDAFTAR